MGLIRGAGARGRFGRRPRPARSGRRVAGLLLAGGLALAACGGPGNAGEGGPPDKAEEGPEVTVQAFLFRPGRLEVKAGAAVRWYNEDHVTHTVTSGERVEGAPPRGDGRFDRELDGAGSSYRRRFERPGTYPYFCRIHAGMAGTIVVS